MTGKRRVRRVLIVDDHPIVRQGLRRVMENEDDLTVCGEAETARDARIAIKELNPDVVIADLSLKQGDGIELVRDVRAHYPHLPILVLSMHDETIYAERMLSAGANGYIMKQAASDQFLIALRRVLDGNIYVSEAVGNNMIQKFATGGSYTSRAADLAHDRQGHEYARNRARPQFEHQDGRIASAAHQAKTQSHDGYATGAIRRQLVHGPGSRHPTERHEGSQRRREFRFLAAAFRQNPDAPRLGSRAAARCCSFPS
jgi:DNA-binding NarL/FixJ family response regulator